MEYTEDYFSSVKVSKFSRMYSIINSLIPSIALFHPRIFVNARPLVEDEFLDLEHVATVHERAINQAFSIMNIKREFHQALFDSMFTGIGWIKMGYNPPGEDSFPPYTLNNKFQDDFPMAYRVDPHKIHISPNTEPHSLASSPMIFEEIFLPVEALKRDKSLNSSALKKLDPDASMEDVDDVPFSSDEREDEHTSGKADLIRVIECHDRFHRRLYRWAPGQDDLFLTNEPHPFINQELIEVGPEKFVPKPMPGFMLKDGFQYIPIKFVQDMKNFLSKPPMAYVEGLQDIQVESINRRLDQFKRYSRLIGVRRDETSKDPNLVDTIKHAEDGEVIILDDPTTALEDLNPPIGSPGQSDLEQTAKAYEADTIGGADQVASKGSSRKTATEVGVVASKGSLSRQWMQDHVGMGYETAAMNTLSMWKSERYFPDNFFLNIANESDPSAYTALTAADFNYEFFLDIDVASMEPLVAERDQERVHLLYSQVANNPTIDQDELIRMLLQSSGVRSWQKLFRGRGKIEAETHAMKENIGFLMQGIDPGVHPMENHLVHIQGHSLEALQAIPQFAQMQPQQQQMVLQVTQQHAANHQQYHELIVSGQSAQKLAGVDSKVQSGPTSLDSAARKTGQNFNQASEQEARDRNPR